jgi:hypothetical protein
MAGGAATGSAMFNFSRDICDLLQARASTGHNAFEIVENTFAKIITILRRDPRFANISLFELELMFANVRSETEAVLFNEMHARVRLDEAEDAVHCTLGEPDGSPAF